MIPKLEFREEMELSEREIISCKMKFITMELDNDVIEDYVDSTAQERSQGR